MRAPPRRFAGEGAEPRPGLASGHMPGARSLPQSELFNPDHTYKDRATRCRRSSTRPASILASR